MGWIIALVIINIILSGLTLAATLYSKMHPNAPLKEVSAVKRMLSGSKNKPKWQTEVDEYNAEQKAMKNRPVS